MPADVECSQVDAMVDGYYHKWLPVALQEAFRGHIAQCPSCQSRVEDYVSDLNYRLLRVIAEQEGDPDAVEELWGRFLLEGPAFLHRP